MKPRVKICGVKRVRDARLAVSLGASMIGCVMVRDSKRCATPGQVRSVIKAVGESVPVVLVFRNPAEADVISATRRTGATTVQILDAPETLHASLEKRGLRVIRARQVAAGARRIPPLKPSPRPGRLYLLDSGTGGTGRTFDWKVLGKKAPRHVFVAGGVNPGNVADLMKLKPFGIDLSSGVEASPGVKDPAKLRALFAAIGGAS